MNLKVIFQVGDVDILAIQAKNPIKFCLQAMDILFTRDEMAHGRYKAVRQRGENKPFPPLDPKRVKLIDDKSYLEVYLIYLFFRRHH